MKMKRKKKPLKTTSSIETERTWLSVEQVAKYLGVSKETIYRLLSENKIPSTRINKLHKFYRQKIDKWMLKNGGC
jgi:excisionase family DNA binding protein